MSFFSKQSKKLLKAENERLKAENEDMKFRIHMYMNKEACVRRQVIKPVPLTMKLNKPYYLPDEIFEREIAEKIGKYLMENNFIDIKKSKDVILDMEEVRVMVVAVPEPWKMGCNDEERFDHKNRGGVR